jgi:cytochrome c-type biogenesis protein
MSVGELVSTGPILLAMPVAAAAGAVTFLSPCCLPLVPGYLSFITGMTGAGGGSRGASAPVSGGAVSGGAAVSGGVAVATVPVTGTDAVPPRSRVVAATLLFVLGFSMVFALEGAALGGVGTLLKGHSAVETRVLGVFTILLGLMFAGVFDRFSFAGRIVKPSVRPRAGLAGAPLLGFMFALGWAPCIGPTLSTVLGLSAYSATAPRGAFLAFIYALGLGVPFLLVAFGFQAASRAFAFARKHARGITIVGGALLVCVGILEVSGAWTSFVSWIQVHWPGGYSTSF